MNRFVAAFLFLVLLLPLACQKQVPTPDTRPPAWKSDPQADAALQEGRLEEAIERYQRLLEAEPGNGLALYYLGYAYGLAGEHDQEIEHYERAASLGFGDATFFFNLGMALAEVGELERGAVALQRAATMDPDNAENHFGLGMVLESLGRNDAAIAAFGRTVELEPSRVAARFSLARLLLRAGDPEEARQQLEAVLRFAPDSPEAPAAKQLLRELSKGIDSAPDQGQ